MSTLLRLVFKKWLIWSVVQYEKPLQRYLMQLNAFQYYTVLNQNSHLELGHCQRFEHHPDFLFLFRQTSNILLQKTPFSF